MVFAIVMTVKGTEMHTAGTVMTVRTENYSSEVKILWSEVQRTTKF